MLEIHQRTDFEGYEKILTDLDLSPESVNILEAFDRGAVTGFAVYGISDDAVEIYKVSSGGDLYLFDGLVRTALFKASMLGIDKAVLQFSEEDEKESCLRLHFVKPGENEILSIQAVMDGCKNCKNSC